MRAALGALRERSRTLTEQPLRGWKDIAAFLGTSPRSAQRWERELGMPIQRLRGTTGSVVSAYTSELDRWRKTVGAELRREETPGYAEAEPDLDGPSIGGTTGPPAGGATEPRPSQAAHRPGRRTSRWIVPAAAAVVVVLLGSGWLWLQRPATTEPGHAAGAAQGSVLRVTSGTSIFTLRAGADQMATLNLPGTPELHVRAIPAGSELTVELFEASGTSVSSAGLARFAALRLTSTAPGDLVLPGGVQVNIRWEAENQSR